MSDTRLTDAANDMLVSIPGELTANGIDVPSHRYIHSGVIAHDFTDQNCADAFIVAWTNSSQGELGSAFQGAVNPIRCAMPLNHTFVVALLRCVPTLDRNGRAPTQTALQSSGESILTDAMSLSAAIVDLVGDGGLLPSFNHPQVAIQLVSAIGPQGGVGGAVVQLVVSLTA